MPCQPDQEWPTLALVLGMRHRPHMSAIDSKLVLWANVRALMLHRWDEENVNRLARVASVGPATVDRIKKAQTSVGLEVIDKVAQALDVETWQLLVPGMDPKNLPVLMPMSEGERTFYERVISAAKALKDPK